jgi:hypothetical protein
MKCKENKNVIKRIFAGLSIAVVGTVLLYNSGLTPVEGGEPVALYGGRVLRNNMKIDPNTTYFY